MRLINVRTLELHEFIGADVPPYAILSHTWGKEEVSYRDWQDLGAISSKAGFAKIQGACEQAKKDSLLWLWVDTNCIDKTSSAELTEAINSMYRWYAKSEICYAYLSDVDPGGPDSHMRQLEQSRWFTRGWTLQELLAPSDVIFFDASWSRIGRPNGFNRALTFEISRITGIHHRYIAGVFEVKFASIAERMSWLSRRQTTRLEDMAYCMLGLFDINIPLLYGEGAKAFTRLQEEIIKVSNDHTIFCWSWMPSVPMDWTSLLAPSPDTFRNASHFRAHSSSAISTYSVTNAGLSIQLPVIHIWNPIGGDVSAYMLVLKVQSTNTSFSSGTYSDDQKLQCIPAHGFREEGVLCLQRGSFPTSPVSVNRLCASHIPPEQLFVITKSGRRNMFFPLVAMPEPGIPNRIGVFLFLDPEAELNIASVHPIFSDQFRPGGNIRKLGVLHILEMSCARHGSNTFSLAANFFFRLQLRSDTTRRSEVESAILFLAAVTNGSTIKWFCQLFSASCKFGTLFEQIPDLQHQLLVGKSEQMAHYNRQLDISVMISDPVYKTDLYREMRALQISQGRLT
jgi:hypothetical protein